MLTIEIYASGYSEKCHIHLQLYGVALMSFPLAVGVLLPLIRPPVVLNYVSGFGLMKILCVPDQFLITDFWFAQLISVLACF
jgi:hypothetical protein